MRVMCRWQIVLGIIAMSLVRVYAIGQEHPCSQSSVASVPSRPTVASATDLTQCGVAELEYGVERQWMGGGNERSDLSGGIRFGLLPQLDFHWFSGDYISVTNPVETHTGYGDNWFGLKYRYLTQNKHRPSLGIFYQVKAPTGGLLIGGSGKTDHVLAFLASKDIRKLHLDFNVIPQFIGRPGAAGFDHNAGLALSAWLPVTKRLTMVAEPYGYTSLNALTPSYTSMMLGGSFRVNQRLFLDTGFDAGVSHFAPHKRVYGGVTYAIANAYTWLKRS